MVVDAAELNRRIEELEQIVAARDAALEEKDAALSSKQTEYDELVVLLKTLRRDNELLKEQVQQFLRRRYGPKGDQFAPGQLALFVELFGEDEATKPDPVASEAPDVEVPKESPAGKGRGKGRKQRKLEYQALPRRVERLELAEHERVCPITGKTLVEVGVKRVEKLEYQPAQLYVQVHEQVEYGLSEEDRQERMAPTIAAPLPTQPIDGLLAGRGLLARVLVAKYVDHLPLHRQEAIFAREGLHIARQTLCEWVMRSVELLMPIVKTLRRRVQAGDLLQCDDTRILCQENSKGGGRRWAYLWAWLGEDRREVVYDFSLSRGHEVVDEWIDPEWSGYLVGDGYSGFGTVCAKRREQDPAHPIVEAGCWAHARRKVREAALSAPEDAVKLAGMIRSLYRVEKDAAKLPPEGRHRLRRERCLPVLWRMRTVVREMQKHYAPEDSMGKALTYIRNQWRTLRQYLKDGRLPIDNNACEQAIRPIAVGRKNWLFTGSPRGGEIGAAIYSLVECCKRAGVEPFDYLRDVLVRIRVHPAECIEDLIPLRWKKLREAGELDPLGR